MKKLPTHENGVDETQTESFEGASVYKICRQIRYNNINIISKMPKTDKYTIGAKLEDAIADVLVGIATTYRTTTLDMKKMYISRTMERADYVLITTRLLHDINVISKDRYSEQIKLIISLIKQLTNWKNSIDTKAAEEKKDESATEVS